MSSHPGAVHALCKLVRTYSLIACILHTLTTCTADLSPRDIDTAFIAEHGANILATCPIPYLQNVRLTGQLFDPNAPPGTVSLVDSSFPVDHQEPLEALQVYNRDGGWPLGDLLDDHEFFVILEIPEKPETPPQAPPSDAWLS